MDNATGGRLRRRLRARVQYEYITIKQRISRDFTESYTLHMFRSSPQSVPQAEKDSRICFVSDELTALRWATVK